MAPTKLRPPNPLRWLIALILGLACASCCASEPVDTSPLLAVSNFKHPPFSSLDAQGGPVGLEVDFVNEAAKRLGREVEWSERTWVELGLSSVNAGTANLAAATIGITEEREGLVAFTQPYFETEIVVLARDAEGEPRLLDELGGLRVVTERGTTAVPAIAKRVPDALGVLDREDERSWGELLAAGEVDAVVLDRSHAETFMDQAGVRFHVLEEPLAVERFAIAVGLDDVELKRVLDEVIAEHKARATER